MDSPPGHAIIVGVSGVAAATASLLAAKGLVASISLIYRSRAAEAAALRDALASPALACAAFRADVTADAEVRAAFAAAVAAHGPPTLVINAAGATVRVPLEDLEGATDEIWGRLYSTNVIGAFHVTRAAAAAMGGAPSDGSTRRAIINISSVAGRLAQGSSLPYACSKAALDALTAGMARTLAPRGIRVLGVAPGFIAGEWLEGLLGDGYAGAKAAFEASLPLRRVCTPESVAEVVVALGTGAAAMTGQTVVVDGGMCIAGFSATL